MMVAPLAALAAAVAAAPSPLAEAAHAIAAGRNDQARVMIARAVAAGAAGDPVDRLLADLAYATGDHSRALAGYALLHQRHPDQWLFAARAGIAALRLGRIGQAVTLLDRATASPQASWRAWNARAVAADWTSDWAMADRAYARAAELAPRPQAQIANNHGWSLLLRGRWAAAASRLEQAAVLAPADPRIARNRELAAMAIGSTLPERRDGESDGDYAARLNDAGVVAALTGDRARAIAAFARAIETRSTWFARAANNLAAVGGSE